jgi:hypothetical protein
VDVKRLSKHCTAFAEIIDGAIFESDNDEMIIANDIEVCSTSEHPHLLSANATAPNPDISRRRRMYDKSSQYLNRLPCVLGYRASVRFVLFGFNRWADDRTDFLTLFRLRSEPFMKYPG